MKAPTAHTVLEIVHARWGNVAHLVFFFFCFLTNIIVSAMLILGGAAVMTALTGMNTTAVRFYFLYCDSIMTAFRVQVLDLGGFTTRALQLYCN